jgi:hypothetical protein
MDLKSPDFFAYDHTEPLSARIQYRTTWCYALLYAGDDSHGMSTWIHPSDLKSPDFFAHERTEPLSVRFPVYNVIY